MKPTLPRACETEALVWSTETGWPEEMSPPELPGSRHRIAKALLPLMPFTVAAFARRLLPRFA